MAERNDEHPRMTAGRGRLEGKVAAVTAADSGIGRAAARLFAREGASVVCADVAERGETRVDRLIAAEGGEARFTLGDVSRKAVCEEVVGTAIAEFGGLDVLFLNAGTGVRRKIHEMSDEEWDHVVQLNLYSVYHGVRAALPHFMECGSGNVVITASSLGVLASPRYPAYSATKAALINLTRQLALDYGPEVRVNCVCPGPIETNRIREYPPRPAPSGLGAARGERTARRRAPSHRARRGGRLLRALPRLRGVVLRHRARARGGRRPDHRGAVRRIRRLRAAGFPPAREWRRGRTAPPLSGTAWI